MATIDDIKSLASTRLGFARPNSFLVTLPGDFGADARELNTLCSRAILPSKSILTSDRRVGAEIQKVPYGYVVPEVLMTFYMMNDYGIKKYFDSWRDSIIDDETFQIKYKDTFAKDVVIHQLRKPLVGFSKSLGPIRANIGLGGGTVYSVKLIDAFPINLSEITLGNSETDSIVEFSVTFAYTNWVRDESPQNFINGSFNLGQIFA